MVTTALASAWTRRPDTFGALRRHRNFRLFWCGAFVSNTGGWMQVLAQGWLVYELTGSALLLGTVAFLQGLPTLLLSMVGGVLADRVERRRLMVGTQGAQMVLAFLLAGLTLAGVVRVEHVMAIALMSGLVDALNGPVRQGLVADLVPREDVSNAVAVNAAQFRASQLVGPALAGFLVAGVGPGWAFLLNGLSFVAVIASLLLLRLPPRKAPPRQESVWRSVGEGVAFVSRHELLGTLVLLGAVTVGLAYPAQGGLMPVFAASVLRVGADGLGVLMGANGAGALVGALVAASASGFPRRGLLLLSATAAYGLLLLLFAGGHRLEVSAALLFAAGACYMVFASLMQAFLQALAPEEMRGRVLGVSTATSFGLMPLGGLAAGAAAERWGASPVLLAGGALCALFALAVLLARPGLRRLS